MFVTGCIESRQNDNFRCFSDENFIKMTKISVSALVLWERDFHNNNVLILANITGINNIILKLCLKLPPTGTVSATSHCVNQSWPTLPVYCVIAVCEIVFAEIIDHRSRVKMIHHRPIVYTCRPVMLSSSKTHEYTIDRWANRLDSLPSPTQFLPRSGPRSMGKVAHWL